MPQSFSEARCVFCTWTGWTDVQRDDWLLKMGELQIKWERAKLNASRSNTQMPGKEKADTTKSELYNHHVELRPNLVIRLKTKGAPIVRVVIKYLHFFK